MTHLQKILSTGLEPSDLLFRNFFDNIDNFFMPVLDNKAWSKVNYPVDIYETEDSLNIEIAVPGIDKEDIHIEECDGTLTVSYEKRTEHSPEKASDSTELQVMNDNDRNWVRRGISRKSFNMGWKISNKFDLKKIDANMDKGLLQIKVPRAKEKDKLKKLIKIK